MKTIRLTDDLLNPNKIMFHYGKMLESISKGQVNFFPIAVEIHPTAMCNHRCVHCSYKERNESRATLSHTVMSDLIRSIIKMGVRAVYFSGGGEPTLFPNLSDYIQRLSDNNVECSIITNGSCFEQMNLIPIADRLNYIAVSVPAVDKQTFNEITGTDNLERVLSLPGKIKLWHGEKSPIIGSRVILTNKNYKKVNEFLSIIKENGFDYALFKIVRDYEDNGQGLRPDEEKELKDEILQCVDVDKNFTNIHSIFEYRKKPDFINKCWVNQFGMIANVSTDGKVYPNIVEIDKEDFCIGDLYRQSLDEMWNSERHKAVKQRSNEKCGRGECKNCRAISYNQIINQMESIRPLYFDPFI